MQFATTLDTATQVVTHLDYKILANDIKLPNPSLIV